MDASKHTTAKGASKRLILLDSHAIIHRAYHAMPEFASSKGEPTGGLFGLSTMLIKIIDELKPDYIAACYDLPGATYRHEAYKDYKLGRKKTDPELSAQITRSRDIFTALSIPIYEKEGFEADDMLGTIVEELKKRSDIDIVIASGDMDTLQLAHGTKVQIYTLKKGIKDTILYDEDAVIKRFGFPPAELPDFKGLRGDPSDNIIGIKGIGEKTATILIQKFGTIENIYKELKKGTEAFKEASLSPRIIELLKNGEEETQFSKMLATIRRDAPISFSIPEKTWREAVEIKKITDLFAEFEFRTLGIRLKEVLGLAEKAPVQASLTAEQEAFDPREEKKLAIALWLINSSLTNPDREEILRFAHTDSLEEASKAIYTELDKRGLRKVFEDIEMPLVPIIEKMEERGVLIDKEALATLSKTYHKALTKLEKTIFTLAGEEFNVNSPKQLGVILFDRLGLTIKNQKKTEGGAKSTRESELEKLRDVHPIISHILEYRELQKLLSTYIDTIPTLIGADKRLHTTWSQTGSTTGRMSSQNPNLQNIPNKTDLGRAIRNAFVATSGFLLAAFDYSQIELRIAAFLSGDKKLIEIFKSGRDVHSEVAARVFRVGSREVTPDMRRKAKVINFGILYGMGVNALRQNLGGTREEAQKFYKDYFAEFSGLAVYLDRVKADAARKGYTETLFGRRRYFEGINSPLPYIKAGAERMAINAPIQGTEADILKIAMKNIDDFTKERGIEGDVHPLLQVHDELVYEIREEMAVETARDIEKVMESVVPVSSTAGIILETHVSIGKSWGEMAAP